MLGLGRLGWLNLHRLPAMLVLAGVGAHAAFHWRPLAARVRRVLRPQGRRRPAVDAALYLAFTATILTGLAAWLVVPGSAPVLGPAVDGVAPAGRESWIDGHLAAGLIAFAAATHHVGGRWKRIVKAIVPVAGRSAARRGR